MYISKVEIKNFRLLRNSTLDLRKNLSLLVGKNNTGKTSFLVLFEKFFQQRAFHYNDFPLALREQILSLNKDTEIDDLSIRIVLKIQYDEKDHLEHLSEFILDLDPEIKVVNILFECIKSCPGCPKIVVIGSFSMSPNQEGYPLALGKS